MVGVLFLASGSCFSGYLFQTQLGFASGNIFQAVGDILDLGSHANIESNMTRGETSTASRDETPYLSGGGGGGLRLHNAQPACIAAFRC